jgi:uncharacterized phage protein (TIGR02220 family)
MLGRYIDCNHIWEIEELSFYAKGTYCLLAKFVDKEGKCWPSLRRLEKLSNASRPTIIKAISDLNAQGLVEIEKKRTASGDWDQNKYYLPHLKKVVNDIDHVVKEVNHGGKGDLPGVVNDVYTNYSNITNPNNYIVPFTEIIGYLNAVCGTSYKATTKSTQSHIKARWGEGHRIDDFKTVINAKAQEWLSNPEMKKYLRPETLFGTKFESYLQATKMLPAIVRPPSNQIELDPQALAKYSNQLRKVNEDG